MTCTCSVQQYPFVHFILPAIASLAAVFVVTQRTSLALRDETKAAARGSATETIPVYIVADLIYYGNFHSECLEQIKKWWEGAYIYWPFQGKDFLFLILLE